MTALGQRILILGSPGAGKSTLARELGARLGRPVIHLDSLFWTPGWVMKPQEVFQAEVRGLLAAPEWICDGNYGRSLEMRAPMADTLIWLDFPRLLCLWRAVRRVFQYRGRTRPDMGEGCEEKLDLEFLHYIWTFNTKHRAQLEAVMATTVGTHKQFHFKGPKDVTRFLEGIGS